MIFGIYEKFIALKFISQAFGVQLSRLEVIGAVLTVGVLGFWFGIGAALGAKMVNSLEELISR